MIDSILLLGRYAGMQFLASNRWNNDFAILSQFYTKHVESVYRFLFLWQVTLVPVWLPAHVLPLSHANHVSAWIHKTLPASEAVCVTLCSVFCLLIPRISAENMTQPAGAVIVMESQWREPKSPGLFGNIATLPCCVVTEKAPAWGAGLSAFPVCDCDC